MSSGEAVLGEGTRSRTRSLQPMLSGAARYLEGPDTWVVPVGLTGSENIFPIRASDLLARTGSDRRSTVDLLGRMIAELLPGEYRGVYGAH